VGLAFAALAFSVVLGLSLMAFVTWTSRGLQAATPKPSLSAPYAVVFLGGVLGSLAAAGGSTWWLLRPLANPYRQAMLSFVAACGAFLVSLLTQPIDLMFGRTGLLARGVGAAAIAIGLWRRARRLASAR
jgi:hypothetical protein